MTIPTLVAMDTRPEAIKIATERLMRKMTERPEAVRAGTVELVGADTDRIGHSVESVHFDAAKYQRMALAVNPYGDGLAAGRITNRIFEAMYR